MCVCAGERGESPERSRNPQGVEVPSSGASRRREGTGGGRPGLRGSPGEWGGDRSCEGWGWGVRCEEALGGLGYFGGREGQEAVRL